MIKRAIVYNDIVNGEETEISEVIRFAYTLPAVKMYEQETGRRFFDDYNGALIELKDSIKGINIGKINDMTEDEQIELLPILSNAKINNFMLNFIPCLYAEVQDGVFIQTEETHDNATGAMWMMGLVNLDFFMEIFTELNANSLPVLKTTAAKKKTTKA